MNSPDFVQSEPLLLDNLSKVNPLEEAALMKETRKSMLLVNEETKDPG